MASIADVLYSLFIVLEFLYICLEERVTFRDHLDDCEDKLFESGLKWSYYIFDIFASYFLSEFVALTIR